MESNKMYWAVDNRGDIPNTKGLSESVTFGKLPYIRDQFKTGYEWASMYPTKGLHIAQDPIWMKAFIANIGKWLDIWCKKDYDGYFVIDFESLCFFWEQNSNEVKKNWHDWNMQNNTYFKGLKPEGYEKFYRDSWNVAMKKFFVATFDECRKQRPKAKFTIYGIPYISAYEFNNEAKMKEWRDRYNRLHWLWKIQDYILPAIYAPRVVVEKPEKWWQVTRDFIKEYYTAVLDEAARCALIGGGKEVIALNCYRNVPAIWQASNIMWASTDCLDLMFSLPASRGYSIATWDAIESLSVKNEMQDIINTTLSKQSSTVTATEAPKEVKTGSATVTVVTSRKV